MNFHFIKQFREEKDFPPELRNAPSSLPVTDFRQEIEGAFFIGIFRV